jgi:class 3 adenylate cyclase/tetratricopeptide (TPR) repeat protein
MQPAAYLADIAEPKADRRKLTVVMHADMVGYSRLIGLDDAGTLVRLRRMRRALIDPAIARNGGTIRQTAGDSLLVVFDSIDGAMQSAIAIQRGAGTFDRDAPPDQLIRFRIGINIGDAILDGTDMHGDGVIIAVRLESACPPGSICVSRTVRDHARNHPGLRFEKLGPMTLKNIARPVEAFVLHFDEAAATGVIAKAWRTVGRRIPAWRFRRLGAALAAVVPAAIVAAVVGFSNRHADLPQKQEAARAEARHAEEMDRLQALNATEKAMAEALARDKGVPIAALTQILARLGETTNSDDPSEVQHRLEQKAAEYVALRQQVLVLSGDDPQVKALRNEAEVALGKADFAVARAKLQQAADVDRVASLTLADQAKTRSLAAAGSLEESARVAALTLHYRDAADDLGKSVQLAVQFDRHETWRLMTSQAAMLQLEGDEFGDNGALGDSIDLYQQALQFVPRERDAPDWATTQNSLGVSLRMLGERENETRHLMDAVAAFRAALEERPRDRAPRDWAQTHNDLGFALEMLGARDSGTAHLEEAVAAYRAALEERTRDQAPLQWATTQTSLGAALERLGERESGTARLEEAVAAFQAALQERTRNRVPLDWAMTQNNLGNALEALGWRESGTTHLEAAVAAYGAALQERTRDRVPLDWAMTQTNLGSALTRLGARRTGTTHLEAAVAAYRAALQEFTRNRVPLRWAWAHANLGDALVALGKRESRTANLKEAVAAFQAALQEDTRDRVPLAWAAAQNGLGNALEALGERESGTAHLEEAVTAYRSALQEWTRDPVPVDWAATAKNSLGVALLEFGEREGGTAYLEEAVAAFQAALQKWTRDRAPLDWARAQRNLGNAFLALGMRESGTAHLNEAVIAWTACLQIAETAAWPQEQLERIHATIDQTRAEIAQRDGK